MKIFKKELFRFYATITQYLFEKAGKVKTSVTRLSNLCVEIYKTINKLNPVFMNNIFKVIENKRAIREQYKLNVEIPEWKQVTFAAKSLNVYGPKI